MFDETPCCWRKEYWSGAGDDDGCDDLCLICFSISLDLFRVEQLKERSYDGIQSDYIHFLKSYENIIDMTFSFLFFCAIHSGKFCS